MKKRHILFTLTALVLFAAILLPQLVTRISYEQGHTGYVTALDLNDTAAQFDSRGAFYAALLQYKASGVTAAALREGEDGSFDTSLLELSSLAGLDTALIVYGGNEKSLTYEKNLRRLFENFTVKYLVLKAAPNENTHEQKFAQYITNYNLTVVLSENLNQLSNENPPGTSDCLQAANGRVLRCYETLKAPGGGADRVFHQMMNSARDRNTEFLLIHQRTDMGETAADNAEATQHAIKSFCAWMQRAGYTPGPAGTLAGYDANIKLLHAALTALGLLMLIFMLCVVLGKSIVWLDWLIYFCAIAAFAFTYFVYSFPTALYPMCFAALSACFCFTVMLYSTQKLKTKLSATMHLCAVVGISLTALLFCSAALSAALSGADYYLNIEIFRGVIFTLALPIAYALALMLLFAHRHGTAPKALLSYVKTRLSKRHYICLALGCALVLYLYLMRSGNASISNLETQIRNLLGELTLARPRTKEFLIGWPLLMLFALAVKQNRHILAQIVLAVGSSILFASVMNTFCHVFTDVTTSALRTVYGLLFAVPVTLLYLLILQGIKRWLAKRKPVTSENQQNEL